MEEEGTATKVERLLDECLQALVEGQNPGEILKGVDEKTAAEVRTLVKTAQTVKQASLREPSPDASERGKQNLLTAVEKKKANK